MRGRLFLLVGCVSACSGAPPKGQALRVDIHWDPDVTAQCFVLHLEADGHAPVDSSPVLKSGNGVVTVAVFRSDLPEDVRLQAIGFGDANCRVLSVPAEASAIVSARFGEGVTEVALQVKREAVADAGFDAGFDAGAPDAGTADAGTPDAGSDAGVVDAGTDAGFDGGLVDAGTDAGTDGGVAELCNNRVDDDSDGLVDCADPDCAAGVACNDANLCTAGEVCGGGTCGGGVLMCSGTIAACYVPSGCDAGICLGAPAAARTFCDGGQCDGAGRCAPFCDATRSTLGACFQFEGVLTDGSSHANVILSSSGGFVPGSRKLGYQPLDAGVIVAEDPSLNCTTAATLEAWVRLNAWPDAGERYGVIDNNAQYSMFIYPGGTLRCVVGATALIPGVVTLNAWHHLACVYDGAARVQRSYVDGVQVDVTDAGLADGGLQTLNSSADAGIAMGQNNPYGDVMSGTLDGVRIWCEALAPADLCFTPGECG